MKLVLQIALGVFLGTLASQFTMDGWRSHQEANMTSTCYHLLTFRNFSYCFS